MCIRDRSLEANAIQIPASTIRGTGGFIVPYTTYWCLFFFDFPSKILRQESRSFAERFLPILFRGLCASAIHSTLNCWRLRTVWGIRSQRRPSNSPSRGSLLSLIHI